MAYRVLVASLVLLCFLLLNLLLERTGFLDQPEVVSCQIGHPDMEVRVSGSSARKRGEVAPRYEFWLPPVGGYGVYYYDRPLRD